MEQIRTECGWTAAGSCTQFRRRGLPSAWFLQHHLSAVPGSDPGWMLPSSNHDFFQTCSTSGQKDSPRALATAASSGKLEFT